jgi:hypothetical protein
MPSHNRGTDIRAHTEHGHLNTPENPKHLKSLVLRRWPAAGQSAA